MKTHLAESAEKFCIGLFECRLDTKRYMLYCPIASNASFKMNLNIFARMYNLCRIQKLICNTKSVIIYLKKKVVKHSHLN